MGLKATMVIPSYWAREENMGPKDSDVVYDHPIPLNQEGTLKRAIESINILKERDFNLVILAIANAKDIEERVEKKVAQIISSIQTDIPIYLFSHSQLRKVHELLKMGEEENFKEVLNLHGYSPIRNMCLFLPHVLDSDIAVLIDDDEVFEDPYFMNKAKEFIGQKLKTDFIGAVAGYYLQPDGDWHLKAERKPWMEFWDKTDRMNEAFEKIIDSKPRLKETPFVFGGNMIVHKDIFTRIPFDPNMTRGEDIDFLINMKMFGYKFFLDNTLSIKHLPPPKPHPIWKQLREDIYRFVFEREKLRNQETRDGMTHVSPEELDPYPGAFLKDDLEDKISRACRALANHYRQEGTEEDVEETLKNITIARSDAVPKENAFHHLIHIKNQWEQLMTITSDKGLKSRLRKVFV